MVSEIRVLNRRQVAKLLGLNPEQVRRMALAGQIPHQRTGSGKNSKYLFSASAIGKWLEGNTNHNSDEG